jgi:hypothetical protein
MLCVILLCWKWLIWRWHQPLKLISKETETNFYCIESSLLCTHTQLPQSRDLVSPVIPKLHLFSNSHKAMLPKLHWWKASKWSVELTGVFCRRSWVMMVFSQFTEKNKLVERIPLSFTHLSQSPNKSHPTGFQLILTAQFASLSNKQQLFNIFHCNSYHNRNLKVACFPSRWINTFGMILMGNFVLSNVCFIPTNQLITVWKLISFPAYCCSYLCFHTGKLAC